MTGLAHARRPAPGVRLSLVALLAVLSGWLPATPPPAAAQEAREPRIAGFSPQGTARGVRQVIARFSEPMVPLGDPRPAGEVFEVACPEPGTARWVDSREWAYDFARNLPAGVRCTFRLRTGLAALDGRPLGGPREFAFSTGGPAIVASLPRAGSSWIDEAQAFVLALDAEATEASVLRHVAFAVEDVPERIGVRLLTGPEREAIVKSRRRALPPGPVLVLQARQRFPHGKRVQLVWGRGVATAGGVATDEDQALDFTVRAPFTVRFSCERERRDTPCVPVSTMHVSFSAPVPRAELRRIALVGPGGRRWSAETRGEESLAWSATFRAPFPESAALRLEVPPDLRDDAGRRAINADRFPLPVRTGPFPPLAKFAARFGIVERADPVLPVTLRRVEPEIRARLLRADRVPRDAFGAALEAVRATVFRIPPEYSTEILPWLRRVAAAGREASVFGPGAQGASQVSLPKPGGPDAFEVVGLPLGGPGLHVVELESRRLGAALLGKDAPMYVPTAALVTNLSVHLKWGGETALVWVTTLDRARPVDGARVTVQDCAGTVLWRGRTDDRGLARATGLPARETARTCADVRFGDDFAQSQALAGLGEGLLVVAQTPGDLGLVHSSWDDGIEPWRFGLPGPRWQGPVTVHTVLDRPLFRAGETVHMKHVLRKETAHGFAVPTPAERPARATIQHAGSDDQHEVAVRWDAAGIAETTWPIPRGARLGRYEIVFHVPRPARGEGPADVPLTAGSFRVEEFRLPFMRAVLRPPTEPQVAPRDVPLDLGARYLAGGAARGLPVVVRAQVQPRPAPAFEGFERFAFANGAVAEGVRRRGGTDDEDETGENGTGPLRGVPAVHQREALALDQAGTGRVTIRDLPRTATPRDLLAELEYRDPAGETQTVATRIPLWPAARLVGIRPASFEVLDERVTAHVAVVDLAGRPVAGAPVAVAVLERRLYSSRKRLVGGFYAYEHIEEVRRVGELCRGETGPAGVLVCEGAPGVTGQLILEASSADAAGRPTLAHADVWVVDRESRWWFDVRESDRIDVLPERRRYEPGETARFQVRMPFREATALVTVEREDVIDAFVVPLAGAAPTIEVPVRGAWAPNVFVSVLAVRGRAGDVQPTAMVDLGRPAFKLGVAEIRVGWREHELAVQVSAPRATWRVRETVPVRIAVRTAAGAVPPPGSEVAVAAVDEALLELLPNPSWSLLEAMMRRRGHAVLTGTAQTHVVGKRHFGLKALPQGGGGGRETTRELFDTLLAWRARVPLDARGEAAVDVPLGDALTSVRIVAIATGGTALFGTGALTVRSTQDLMVLPGLPPLVREGDRFAAEVTLRNATERPMEVVARGHVEGLAAPLAPRSLRLAPGEAQVVAWDVTAPAAVEALRYTFEAGEAGGASDRVALTQRVLPAVPVRPLQATLVQWDPAAAPLRQAVERPADALPGRGGVRVTLRPTLAVGLDGLRDWMRRYPYTCLEQRVSRAVALRDREAWDAVTAEMPAHLDPEGLLAYFPRAQQGSDALTAYVLAIAHEAGWPLPDTVRERALGALRAFAEGRSRARAQVPSPDLTLRKLAALEALGRHGRARASDLGSVRVEPELWPTSGVLDWWSLLRRLPDVPERARRLAESERVLRARLNLQGTVMGFSTERADALWWLMVSGDVNAVRLVLGLLEAGVWRDELPRLVRGALARQRHGAWDLTVANAWGVLALERFSRAFEATPVGGATRASLGSGSRQIDWGRTPAGGALVLPWPPAGRADVAVEHAGAGRPWIGIQSEAAVPLAAPLSSGYRLAKTLVPIERRHPDRWTRGDLVRVRLEIEAQADMAWVVVDDPVPGGTSHVGRGLGRESAIAGQGERADGCPCVAHQERRFDAFRAYYSWVPKGRFALEYTVRLDQAGRFALPPTRVEALYAPEMFGELPQAPLEVGR